MSKGVPNAGGVEEKKVKTEEMVKGLCPGGIPVRDYRQGTIIAKRCPLLSSTCVCFVRSLAAGSS